MGGEFFALSSAWGLAKEDHPNLVQCVGKSFGLRQRVTEKTAAGLVQTKQGRELSIR